MKQPLAFLLLACVVIFNGAFTHDNSAFEGDLYYDFFRMGSHYTVPQKYADTLKTYLDTATIEHAKGDTNIIKGYAILKKENLVYSPYIYVRLNNDSNSIMILYMNKADYAHITRFRYKRLQAKHQKVHLKFTAKQLGNGMFACQSSISIDLIPGQTLQIQRKFKIEDYE